MSSAALLQPWQDPMQSCVECGSERVQVRLRDGEAYGECELCGAVLGENEAAARTRSDREAADQGVDRQVWPVVQALARLQGLHVVASHGGDVEARTLPFVQWTTTGDAGLLQLDNLAKWLALSSRSHRLHWVVELEYGHGLTFTLKPRVDPRTLQLETVREAQQDLDLLHLELERNVRLSWWKHPVAGPGNRGRG